MKQFSYLLLIFCIFYSTVYADNKNVNPYNQKIASLQIEQLGIVTKKRLNPDSNIIKAREYAVAEQLAGYACLTKKLGLFGHWAGEKALESEQCKNEFNFLKKNYPNSPVIPCIEYGQDSEQCKDGSLEQYTYPWREAISKLNLKQELDTLPTAYLDNAKYDVTVRNLWEKIKEIETENSKNTEDIDQKMQIENEIKLIKAYSKLINASCRDYGLVTYQPIELIGIKSEDFSKNIPDPELAKLNEMVERFKKEVKKSAKERSSNPFYHESLSDNQPTNSQTGISRVGSGRLSPSTSSNNSRTAPNFAATPEDKKNDNIDLSEDKKKSNQVEDKNEELVRVLILNDGCFDVQEAMLKAIPLHPAPICIREGIFSPQCHGARKRYTIEKVTKRTTESAESGVEF